SSFLYYHTPTTARHTLSLHDALPICPVHIVTYEDAEFAKIAVNMMLAAQVDATNRLAAAARVAGAAWWHVAEVLKADQRIGPHADRKSTRLNSSHEWISYAVFCLKKK